MSEDDEGFAEERSGDATDASTATACADCGATLEPRQQFCTKCGTPVTASGSTGSGGGGVLETRHKWILAAIGGVVALVLIIVLVSSGGGDDSAVESAPPPTEDTVPTTEPPPTTTTIPAAPGGTWVLSGSDERGYSSRITMEVGKPKHADPSETKTVDDETSNRPYATREVPRISACAVTKATDAIVPVEVSVENTTGNFPELLGMVLELEGYPGGAVTVQTDNDYAAGAECTDPNDSDDSKLWGFQSVASIEAGGTEHYDEFLIVLHNYYSPAYPDGDVAAYESMRLVPELTFGDTFGEDERRVRDVSISQLPGRGAPTFQIVTSDDGF